MKTIRLSLGKEWYYFDHTQRFRPVGNKMNFVSGDLLYKDSEFFLVHKKKKLIPISWCRAGKKIYGKLERADGQSRMISKAKTIFAFKINKDEEVQTSVRPHTFPFYQEEMPTTPIVHVKDAPLSEEEKRAYSLMYQIAHSHKHLQIKGNYILIRSVNHKKYKLNLKTAQVYSATQHPICVWASNKGNIPFYDLIIAKAITLAYAPERISTIN